MKRFSNIGVVAAVFATIAPAAIAQSGGAPPDTHGNDLYLGLNEAPGYSGSGLAIWFSDSSSNPARLQAYLATPQSMTPNIAGPAGAGNLYFNLGTNVLTDYSSGSPVDLVRTATMQLVSITPGLRLYASSTLLFDWNPANTVNANKIALPYLGGSWHKHYNVRAYKTGIYQMSFKWTNGIGAQGQALADSPVYTLTLRNRPLVQGRILMNGNDRIDSTPYGTGNLVRFYLFPADSTPADISSAIVYTDVYLDADGSFGIPELLKSQTTGNYLPNGSSYRIGVQSLTVPQALTVMIPGNVTISPTSPAQVGDIRLPLGDVDGDGDADLADLVDLLNAYGSSTGDAAYTAMPLADLSGDGDIDLSDLITLLNSYGMSDQFGRASHSRQSKGDGRGDGLRTK